MNDQDKIRQTMAGVTDLLLRKNRDYGSSFRKTGIISGSMTPTVKLLVRIDDKIERMNNLMEKRGVGGDADVPDESLSDTLTDLIGYFVLLKILVDEGQ